MVIARTLLTTVTAYTHVRMCHFYFLKLALLGSILLTTLAHCSEFIKELVQDTVIILR